MVRAQPDGTGRCDGSAPVAPGEPSQQRVQQLPLTEEAAAAREHAAAACRASHTPASSSQHGGPFSSYLQEQLLLGTLEWTPAAATRAHPPASVLLPEGERTCASSGAAPRGPLPHEAAVAAAIDDTDAADMLLSFASADVPDSAALPSPDAGNNEGAADADAEGQARGAKRQRATDEAAAGGSTGGGYWQEVQRRLAFYSCCDAMQHRLPGPAPDAVRAAAAAQAGFADVDEAPPLLHELPAQEAAVVRSLLPVTSGVFNGSAPGELEQRRGSSAMSGGEQLGLLSTGSGRPASQLLQFVAAAIVDEQQSPGSGWPGPGEAAAPAAADAWLTGAAGGYAAAAAAAAAAACDGGARTSSRSGGGGGRSGRSRVGGSSTRGSRGQGTAAAAAGDDGEAGSAAGGRFVLRSSRYTGVYRSRRTNEGWRAQFCASNKVINLGTFEDEDEAARVWNEAARVFRGPDAWLNPVEPPLPPDYTEGVVHLGSDRAAQAVMAAAAAAKLRPPRVIVKQHGA